MTDKELLEFAARAAGYKDWVDFSEIVGEPALSIRDKGGPGMWSPLTDDGDALRLACRLSADIFINQATVRVEIGRNVVVEDISGGDKPAATRRAIARAAAEIGKGMK